MNQAFALAIIVVFCWLDLVTTLIASTEIADFDLAWTHFKHTYYLGEATVDLIPISLLRCVAIMTIVRLVLRKKRTEPVQSIYTPLMAITRTLSTEEPKVIQVDEIPLLYRSIYRRKMQRLEEERKGLELSLTFQPHQRAMSCVMYATLIVTAIKCLARLFQPSPKVESCPAEWFWVSTITGSLWAVIQDFWFGRWLRKVLKTRMTEEERREDEKDKKNRDTLKSIIKIALPDWRLLILAYIALAVAAAGESALPFLLGEMVQRIGEKNFDLFHTYMLYTIGTAALTGIFTGIRGSTFLIVGARFSRRLQSRLFSALLRQDMAFFDATKTGELTSRLSSDCQKVSDQVQLNVNIFLRSCLQACFVLGFMAVISWKLALTAFVSVPSIVLTSKTFGRYVEKLSKRTQQTLADASATAEESLGGMKTVRSVAGRREVKERYLMELAEYYIMMKKQASVYAVYAALTFTFLPQTSFCIVLYYGASLVGSESINLTSFVFYMNTLFAAFNSLGNIFTGLVQAIGAASKVFEWINREPRDPVVSIMRHIPAEECKGDIALNNVSFEYPGRPGKLVLQGLSLHAKPGQVVALCGESGGGKSSCISLLERFYAPTSGTVTLDGIRVEEIEPECYHRLVALVGQEPVLFGRTIRENILFGFLASGCEDVPHERQMIEAAQRANAHDFISDFPEGYDTEVGERGTQLSGGQKQRIAIARALVRRPKVLILDEATSALDADSESVVQQAIDSMIAEGSMTVIVIAHRLSTIKNANQIVVIKNGRAVEQGTHEELVSLGGVYQKLVTKQLQLPV